jgi:hypothetical protein
VPTDPKKCRDRALECMELARNTKTPQHKQALTDIAQSWINLACEVERTTELLEGHPPPANDRSVTSERSH